MGLTLFGKQEKETHKKKPVANVKCRVVLKEKEYLTYRISIFF